MSRITPHAASVAPAAPKAEKDDDNVYDLAKEQELRIEVGSGGATVKLLSGAAEIFGTEMGTRAISLKPESKVAVFTWYGAQVQMTGSVESAYTADDTPMRMQLNIHANLEAMRKEALQRQKAGPCTMVVGPTDAGKSTLCKILTNYAVRTGWEPLFVDLDVGQGMITIPGNVAAVHLTAPIDVEKGLSLEVPLAFFGGTVSPGDNPALYRYHTERLAGLLDQRSGMSARRTASGTIVNTMGWINGEGYELLLHTIEALHVDVVVVIGHDKLYSDLSRAFKAPTSNVQVVKLPKSGGVVTRQVSYRRDARDMRISEYFYGPSKELSPSSSSVGFDEWKVFSLGGGPRAPDSALPIGAKPMADPVRAVEMTVSKDLMHSILAVTYAQTQDELLTANVAGFVYVYNVDVAAKRIHYLSPCPGALPSGKECPMLIAGSIKWYEK